MTTFSVFDRGGYVVRACLPADEAATLATAVGGIVRAMPTPTPAVERIRLALDVVAYQVPDLPQAVQWFLDDAREALAQLEAAR